MVWSRWHRTRQSASATTMLPRCGGLASSAARRSSSSKVAQRGAQVRSSTLGALRRPASYRYDRKYRTAPRCRSRETLRRRNSGYNRAAWGAIGRNPRSCRCARRAKTDTERVGCSPPATADGRSTDVGQQKVCPDLPPPRWPVQYIVIVDGRAEQTSLRTDRIRFPNRRPDRSHVARATCAHALGTDARPSRRGFR